MFCAVSRLECSSVSYDMQLLLDVNIDIYPVELGDKLTVALAKSLTDNEMDDGVFDQSGRASLADEYEYVMYGKVFKCLEDKGSKVYAQCMHTRASTGATCRCPDGGVDRWLLAGRSLFPSVAC